MTLKQHFELQAQYNQWMNDKLYELCAGLTESELNKDRGAFFQSISGTLNHLLLVDRLWLQRFSKHPAGFGALKGVAEQPLPDALDQILYRDFAELQRQREKLDRTLSSLCDEIEVFHLAYPLSYLNMHQHKFEKRFGYLLQHLFNHQTHHRGQLTTLLSQQGIAPGVTDLLAVIPEA